MTYKSLHNNYLETNKSPDPSAWQPGAGVLPLVKLGSPGSPPPVMPRLKVFVPPGALKISLVLYCAQQSILFSQIKYKDLPVGTCNQFLQENSFPFSQFNSGLCLQNAGGHIAIYTMALLPPDATGKNPPSQTGGWLYVINHNAPESIGQIQYSVIVDLTTYLTWYNSYSVDLYGLGGTVIPPGMTEFERGKQYCRNNPQACGIVELETGAFNIKINSFDMANGNNIDRYDVLLTHTPENDKPGELSWALKSGGLQLI